MPQKSSTSLPAGLVSYRQTAKHWGHASAVLLNLGFYGNKLASDGALEGTRYIGDLKQLQLSWLKCPRPNPLSTFVSGP